MNSEYDQRVDVYSFGVMLNFMITLTRPYDDIPGNNAWLLKSINTGEPAQNFMVCYEFIDLYLY